MAVSVNDSFRLVYRVDSSARTVTLLLLGDRKEVYERLGSNADGSPGIRVIASGVDDLLDVEPSGREAGEATLEGAGAEPLSSEEDADLPVRLTAELLREWGVREEYHQSLEGVRTEGELPAAEIPGSVIERVMDGLYRLLADESEMVTRDLTQTSSSQRTRHRRWPSGRPPAKGGAAGSG